MLQCPLNKTKSVNILHDLHQETKESLLWPHLLVVYLPNDLSHTARFTICLCRRRDSSLRPLGCRSSSRWQHKLPAAWRGRWWDHWKAKEKMRYMQVHLGRDFVANIAQVLRASEEERKFSNERQPSLCESWFAVRGRPGGFSWLSHFIFYEGPALPCREPVSSKILLLKYSLSRGANLQICFCHQSGKKVGV